MDTAFLEDKPLDEAAKTPEDEARAAEELYASQLAKELRVKLLAQFWDQPHSITPNLLFSKNKAPSVQVPVWHTHILNKSCAQGLVNRSQLCLGP